MGDGDRCPSPEAQGENSQAGRFKAAPISAINNGMDSLSSTSSERANVVVEVG